MLMTSEENIRNLYQMRKILLVESRWSSEAPMRSNNANRLPRFLEYLKVIVLESSMRAYIGDGKVRN